MPIIAAGRRGCIPWMRHLRFSRGECRGLDPAGALRLSGAPLCLFRNAHVPLDPRHRRPRQARHRLRPARIRLRSRRRRIGLQAAEALGVEPSRVLKTLMALVDGKPVCVVVHPTAK